jgi:hypothetical protein
VRVRAGVFNRAARVGDRVSNSLFRATITEWLRLDNLSRTEIYFFLSFRGCKIQDQRAGRSGICCVLE